MEEPFLLFCNKFVTTRYAIGGSPASEVAVQTVVRWATSIDIDVVGAACCSALGTVCLHSDVCKQITIEAGAVGALISCVSRQDCPLSQEAASGALMNLASLDEETKILLFNSGAVPPLVSTLARSTQAAVVGAAAGALMNLSTTAVMADAVLSSGAIKAVAAALGRFKADAVIENCIGLLQNFSKHSESFRKRCADAGFVDVLARLVPSRHISTAAHALEALRNVASVPSNAARIVDVGVTPKIVELIADANDVIAVPAAALIQNLALSDTARASAIEHHAVASLVKVVGESKSSNRIAAALSALWALMAAPPALQLCAEAGLLSHLLAFVGAHGDHTEQTLIAANACLAHMAAASDDSRRKVGKARVLRPLIQILAGAKSDDLIASTAAAIRDLSQNGSNRGLFGDLGAVPALVSAVERSRSSVVHTIAAQALRHLVGTNTTRAIALSVGAGRTLATITAKSHNAEAAEAAAQALAVLSETETGRSRLGEEGVHRHAVSGLERWGDGSPSVPLLQLCINMAAEEALCAQLSKLGLRSAMRGVEATATNMQGKRLAKTLAALLHG